MRMRLRSTGILALCSAGVLLAQEQAMVDGRAMRIDANDKLSLAHGRGRDGAIDPSG